MKKNLLIIAVALVVLGGGVATYAVLNNKSDDKKTTESATAGDSSATNMNGMPQDQGTQNSGASTDTSQGGGTTGSTGSGSGNASSAASTDQVKISNFAFSPASITIKVGTKVTWTNGDEVKHNVAMDDGAEGPSSQMLSKGDTYTYTFTKAGTFKYHCTPHPSMKGTVIVTE